MNWHRIRWWAEVNHLVSLLGPRGRRATMDLPLLLLNFVDDDFASEHVGIVLLP